MSCTTVKNHKERLYEEEMCLFLLLIYLMSCTLRMLRFCCCCVVECIKALSVFGIHFILKFLISHWCIVLCSLMATLLPVLCPLSYHNFIVIWLAFKRCVIFLRCTFNESRLLNKGNCLQSLSHNIPSCSLFDALRKHQFVRLN